MNNVTADHGCILLEISTPDISPVNSQSFRRVPASKAGTQ
jgi:hypothetical protein